MTKKQLYFVIAALGAVLLYVLFVPATMPEQQQFEEVFVEEETTQDVPAEVVEYIEDTEETKVLESVVLEGVFTGLLDGENAYGKKFKYLLLHDGLEVLRIDLRPLVGMSDINIIEKIGVERGDTVTVVGVMDEGVFVVERIE